MVSDNRITVNLSDSNYADLCTLSEKHSVSLAWLGRQAIIDFLTKCREGSSFPAPTAGHEAIERHRTRPQEPRGGSTRTTHRRKSRIKR